MHNMVDRCIFNATSTGTGDFVVASAVTGYLTPAQAGADDTAEYHYAAQTVDASNSITAWEVGSGTYSTSLSTLTRTTIEFSSNSNTKVNFSTVPQVMITALSSNFRRLLDNNTTIYVSTSGNDTTGDGTTVNPWKTLQKACNYASERIDLAGYNLTIQLAAGTTASPAVYAGASINNLLGGGDLIIETSDGNVLRTKITGTSNPTIDIGTNNPSTIWFGGMWLESTGNNIFIIENNADVIFGTPNCPSIKLGQSGNLYEQIILQDHASLNIPFTTTVTLSPQASGCRNFILASGARAAIDGTYIIEGNPAWGTSFIKVSGVSYVDLNTVVGSNVTGTSTGKRYIVLGESCFRSVGAISSIPGDTAGDIINSSLIDVAVSNSFAKTVNIGQQSSFTGALVLSNASSTAATTIQAGNATTAATYTLPTALGAAGATLFDAAGNGTLSWNNNVGTQNLTYVIDGNGSPLTTGTKGYLEVPFDCGIMVSTLLADQAGAAVVDIWKCTYSAFDAGATHPATSDSITSASLPTITTGTSKAQDSTLTNWSTATTAGSILAFHVNSVSTITRLTASLKVQKR